MAEDKKLTHLQAVLKETYLSLMGSHKAKRFCHSLLRKCLSTTSQMSLPGSCTPLYRSISLISTTSRTTPSLQARARLRPKGSGSPKKRWITGPRCLKCLKPRPAGPQNSPRTLRKPRAWSTSPSWR